MTTTRQMRREAKEDDMIVVQFVSPDASSIKLTVDPDLVEDNPEAAGQYLVHEFIRLWENEYERRRRMAIDWMAGHPPKRERGATCLTPDPMNRQRREEERAAKAAERDRARSEARRAAKEAEAAAG